MKKSRYVKLVPKESEELSCETVALKDTTFDRYWTMSGITIQGEEIRRKYFILPLYENEEDINTCVTCDICGGSIEPFLEKSHTCLNSFKIFK